MQACILSQTTALICQRGSVKSPACWARYYRDFQQRMLAVTWELERTFAFFGRTSNINSTMFCAASVIQEDWFILSKGEAQKCQQKHAEATGRLRFLWSFRDTLEIATGGKNKPHKKSHPKFVISEEFHGFQILKPISRYRGFVNVLFMENEHLNLNHPQCFCDLIALLGTTSWIHGGECNVRFWLQALHRPE